MCLKLGKSQKKSSVKCGNKYKSYIYKRSSHILQSLTYVNHINILHMAIQDSNVLTKRANLHVHICDLPRTSGSNLPKLPPNVKFYNRWKRNLQKLILVSARHPLTHLILRSQAAITFEKRRHSRSPHRWMIHPCSMLRYED